MDERADLRQRLERGDWLTPGEVARLTGASRASVHRWLAAEPPLIRWRNKPFSRHRECNPADVQAVLRDLDAQAGDV
jgi:hypothetical protein